MSKTFGHGTGGGYNGLKHPLYEYWSRRPTPYTKPCKKNKILTHKIERSMERQFLYELMVGMYE